MLSHLTDPVINPGAALAWGGLSATQWLVACRGHAQQHPHKSQSIQMLKVGISVPTMLVDVGGKEGQRA